MSGDKQYLSVYLSDEKIADINIASDRLHWNYCQSWNDSGYAISPHLPLIETIRSLNVERFLKNLLPEGGALEELVNNLHLSKNNTFALIQALGLDTPGSLIILNADNPLPQNSGFRPIKVGELEKRLDERDIFPLIIWDGKPRLSVAGVQDKINVVLNQEKELGFGEGSLCSTHILKFEKHKHAHLVLNEYFSMHLAKACGLDVAEVELMRFGHHPALLVKRFDRKLEATGVKRRHMIDGCQALNVPPEYKYEQNFGGGRDVAHIRDGVSLPKLYAFADLCINPAKTKLQILDWVLFNVLIFNCDAHGKNISFFVSEQGISLTPFYDLVNVKMYPDFEHALAMALGDEFDGHSINAYQLADFADTCNLPRILVTKRLAQLIENLRIALQKDFALVLNAEEQRYLNEYRRLVLQRCEHLQNELLYITKMKL